MGLRQNLSRRELEVGELLTADRSASEIADVLNVSKSTVYTHIDRIQEKTGSSTLDEAKDWLSSWFVKN